MSPGEEADLIDVDLDKKPGGGGGGGGGGFTAPVMPMGMPMPMPMPMPTAFNYPPPNGAVRDFFLKTQFVMVPLCILENFLIETLDCNTWIKYMVTWSAFGAQEIQKLTFKNSTCVFINLVFKVVDRHRWVQFLVFSSETVSIQLCPHSVLWTISYNLMFLCLADF